MRVYSPGSAIGGSWRQSMNNIGSRKSLSLYRDVWINLAQNQRYSTYITSMDITVFVRRLKNEGITFLLKTLPNIGKALDKYHSTYEWTPPADFQSDGDGLPIFMGNAVKASLRGDSEAVDCVRQLSYLFYKLEMDFDQEFISEHLSKFKDIDRQLGDIDFQANNLLIDAARRKIFRILCNADPRDIRPCHGSGATADRMKNYEKWHQLKYYRQLDDFFPYPDYFFYSLTHLEDELDKLEKSQLVNPQARLCFVPKDSRGPRTISCEPSALMYIQQGLMRKLYEVIEHHPLTRGFVNFTNQEINRSLAYSSSKTGERATLDLSDASDRVAFELVKRLFPSHWLDAFKACRSESTLLPNGEVMVFNKFAPMGSACCFPVEALVFWAIASASIPTSSLDRDVYVYGDDIIVHSENTDAVISGLESVGLKVNRDKSYSKGPFRESCGGDYHSGYDVTPVRVRKSIGISHTSRSSDVEFCNLMIAKFGESASARLVSFVESLHTIPFPRTSLGGIPCCLNSTLTSSNDVHFRRRWNKNLQRYEHRIPQPYMKTLVFHEAAWSELLRKELTRELRSRDQQVYESLVTIQDSQLQPGEYTVNHPVKTRWQWVWLG